LSFRDINYELRMFKSSIDNKGLQVSECSTCHEKRFVQDIARYRQQVFDVIKKHSDSVEVDCIPVSSSSLFDFCFSALSRLSPTG